MSYRITPLQEKYLANLARLETAIGQDSPLNDKAFLRVLAMLEAALSTGNDKQGADEAKQNLAISATGDGLDRIGNDNSTPRKLAVQAELEVDISATTGMTIPAGTEFTGDSNGMRYKSEADVVAVAGIATLSLLATESGTNGNLDNGETLSISAQIAGAGTQATVTDTLTLGVDKESDADYRPRVIFAQRAITGGCNATDHKIWGEAVTGVKRVFPYSGRPTGISYPGDRTVYVEAQTSIDADGLAPAPLIADVRDALEYDPDTGESRTVLGLTDATLWVESIIRTSVYIRISDLDVETAKEAACKAALDDACDNYFRTIYPFVDGVDVVQERTDTITVGTLSRVIQDVLTSFGANCQGIAFGIVAGVYIPLYLLNPGELTKLGAISYV